MSSQTTAVGMRKTKSKSPIPRGLFSGTEQTVLTELTENIAMVKHAERQLLELTNDV